MSRSSLFFLALAGACFASPASAGSRMNDPYVIPGIDEQTVQERPMDMRRMEIVQPPSSRGGEAYGYNAPDPTPARAAPRRGYMGGGFLEALTDGFSSPAPQSNAYYNVPPARQRTASYAPEAGQVRRAVPAEYMRAEVDFPTRERPGSIIIDTQDKYLYYILPQGRAVRYGIGVGRPGFTWSGVKTVSRKAEWPAWTPPREMLRRRPDLPAHMEGGEENPLGARAMYLGSSLYRIHGTNEPYTIGQNVSSGCIRLTNDDVIDLYERVKVGARVVVM